MTSAINPSIDVNYPVPGVNNNSQGFRTNFTSINTSLQTAATEITELQTKALLKSAITGTVLDNDMSNGLIKNAQTLGFRASTYPLGNRSGSVNIDLTLGDIQFGVATGNITLTFSKWSPDGTGSSVGLVLTVTPGQVITLPSSVSLGVDTIEGYASGSNTITIPVGVTRVHYQFNSLDCGTTIEIVPVDRPRKSTQLVAGTLSQNSPGTPGQIAYDSSYVYVCVATNTWKRSPLSTW